MKAKLQKIGFIALALFAVNHSAKADDAYGRYLLCDTKTFASNTGDVKTQRFFNAQMGTVTLNFSIDAGGKTITGSGYAYDGYGRFQLKDSASGETKEWSGYLESAHRVEKQTFTLSIGNVFAQCEYGIPVGP